MSSADLEWTPPPPGYEAHNALVQPRAVLRTAALFALALAILLIASLAGAHPALGQDEPQVPAAPSGLEVSTEAGSLDVELDWDDTSGATSYKVRWRTAGKGNPLNAGITSTSSDADITVATSGDWVVRVEACNAAGCGDPASKGFTTLAGQTFATQPAPTGVTATPTGTYLVVSWTAPSGVTVTDYDLRYYAGSEDPEDAADWIEEREARGLPDPGRSTSATITRLKTDTVYRVQVRAASAVGEGAWSDSASARIDTTAPVLRNARVSRDGTELTLYYDDPLNSSSAPAHGQFSVAVDGSERTLWGGAVTVSGTTVTMNLGTPAVAVGQAVAVSYTVPGTTPIKNLKGIKAPGISGLAAINDRKPDGAAAQSDPDRLAIVSTPSIGADTYGAGGEIKVEFTFDENVTVDTWGGRPRLKIKLHATHGERWASYEGGSGTAVLTFSYTVKSTDSSKGGTPETDGGIAVLANSLDENGAWILSAATGRFMNTAHAGLDHDANHKVDGTKDGRAPRFKSAAVDQTTMIITFDEDLDTSSVPAASRFCVDTTDPDGSARSFCGSNVSIHPVSKTLVTVTLSEGVRSAEAATVSYTVDTANPLKDAAGNKVAAFSGKPVTNYSEAPGQPSGVWASTPTLGGSLDVHWTAPSEGATPTGYDVRYYQGTEDPPVGREADWKEDKNYVAGLPDPGATATSATIQGLRANTAYQVQVRAKTAAEGGPWSASASATTGSPKAGNNPPRVLGLIHPRPATGNICNVLGAGGPVAVETGVDGRAGTIVIRSNLVGRDVGETGAWPSVCNTGPQSDRWAPEFDDVDGDQLTLSVERHPVPDHVIVNPSRDFFIVQPGDISQGFEGQVIFAGLAHFRKAAARAVRAKLIATDPHGAWASIRLFFLVDALSHSSVPQLPEVADMDASTIQAFSHVLPRATGGDQDSFFGIKYYYAISGLPKGLAFDPETRTISGTPSETGSFSVTYIADDPDKVGSAYLNPETENDDTKSINDTASRTFTINVRPYVGLVRVTSAPTHDANGDGRNDTYGEGDKIAIDVEFAEPVEFNQGTGTVHVQIPPLLVGQDSDTSDDNMKTAQLTDVLHGGKTLRFQYTVQRGDNDPDGVSIHSFSSPDEDKMLVLKDGATLKGLVSKDATSLKRADYIVLRNAVDENGFPLSYVNGYLTSAGPKAESATVDGETLRVTFNKELAALGAADLQELTFLFSVQGANGTGGNRNAYQHPSSVAVWSGDTDNRTLELTLGVAARAGEQITLSYKLNGHRGPLKNTDGDMAPAFVQLMVTNNTGGGGSEGAAGASAAAEVTLVSNTGQTQHGNTAFTHDRAQAFTTGSNGAGYTLTKLVVPYVGALPPAGSHTISIHASNSSNRPGDSLGTLAYGTVSGTTVTYTASGTGIDLVAGTTYFAVFDAISVPSGTPGPHIKLTNSDSEDGNAAAGWSLADRSVLRFRTNIAWDTTTSNTAWQIAIHGAALTAEAGLQPELASVAGTKLKIVFDKALDDTASESGQHFTVVMSDRNGNQRTIKGTQANVAISDSTVTVTLAEAVPPNVPAQVTYDPPTLSLKAAADNSYVAGFLGFKIEKVYDTAVPELTQAAVAQTSKNPDTFRVALYYDEALDSDSDSVPATTDFGVTLDWTKDNNTGSTEATPNAVAVEGNTVLLTVDLAKAPADEAFDRTYTMADVSYTKGTNPIRDPAGNEAADVDEDDVAIEAAGTPAVAAATKAVKGDEVKLVGNSAQSNNGNSAFSVDRAQAFTTGSNAEGYKLTKLRIRYVIALPTAASHTISIHASNSSNQPGGSLGTLSYGSASGFDVTYTAPGDGIALDAGTTYFAVLEFSSQGGTGFYRTTDSNAEDAGAAGWTLADGSFSKSMSTTAWSTDTKSWKIALHGAALKRVAATVLVTVRNVATLVSNTEQTAGSAGPFSFDYSQAFTTGSNTDGYRLTSVTVPYNTAAPTSSSHTISIHASNTSDRPDASLGTLGYGTVSGHTVTYTASGNGIALDAETTYFVVLDSSDSSTSAQIELTSSGAEDAGASDGWSLADGLLWRNSGSSDTWSTLNDTWQIAIQGTALTATSEALLVSNTGHSYDSQGFFTYDIAQAFTTGSNAGGYKLTSVKVPHPTAPPASSHTISIHPSNSSNRPGASLGTLSYGSVSGQTVTYTASGTGIALDAGTTYFVVIDTSTHPNYKINFTSSDSEDSGSAEGWSLGNGTVYKLTADTSWSEDTSDSSWQIAIHGVDNQDTIQIEKTLPDLEVDGASLTVTYDKSLDPTSLPDPDRFTLLDEDGLPVGRVTAVAVAGKKLILTLNGAVSPCEPAFTLSYSWSETEKNIRTFTGHEAPDIEAEPVANAQAKRCVNGRAVVVNGEGASGNSGGGSGSQGSQGKQGKSLTLKFDRPLDTGKALKASAFGLAGASGGAPPAVEEAAFTESGAGVALVLARALESGETVTLGYTRSAGESGLWDADGNQIADFSGVAVPVRTSEAPAVTGVEVNSDSGSDDTYALGETIRVRVTFSEAVEVDTAGGAPRLRIDMDPAAHWGMKWAAYEGGSGTESLTFAYEVVQPNESTQGIAVLANTLEANGGAIRSASSGTDVELGHDGLNHDPAHKVNWRLTSAPAGTASVTGVEVVSDSGSDDTYALGETIRVRVTFSEALDVTGTPRLKIKMDPNYGEKWATYESGSGTASLTFTHTVVEPNLSTQGIAVLANTLELNGGAIQASGDDADLSHTALGHNASHKVDWQAEPAANVPASGAATITGTAQVGETLTAGTSGISDADGLDNAVFSYQWLADDVEISGATGSTYTLVDADEGKAVKAKVSFTDDAGHDETVTSTATAPVAAAPVENNAATGAPTITGTAQVGETLTADTSGISDADGLSNAVFSYQWLADDVDISGATGSTYTLVDADEGKAVKVKVSFTDDEGNDESLTSAATAAVTPKPNSAASGQPTITGTAQEGETLTASTSGISDADGLANAVFSYQWLADDADISGATGSTYTLVDADEGKAVKVRVSFTDDAGNDESLTSPATSAVAAALPPPAPTNLVASDNGNGTLTLTWDAPDDDSVTGYQILRRRPKEGEKTLLVYVADTGSTDTNWTDEDVTIGTRHVYRVKAINAAGLSQMSTLARATPTSPPENNAETATAAVAAAPPAVNNIKVDGATVTVTFAVDLAPVSSVDTLHLYWTISGTAVAQHPNRASVSDRTLTLEIGTPAVAGQTITVSYESSGHLKDVGGNALESFSVTATNLTQQLTTRNDGQR